MPRKRSWRKAVAAKTSQQKNTTDESLKADVDLVPNKFTKSFPMKFKYEESITVKLEPQSPDGFPKELTDNESINVKIEPQSPEAFPQEIIQDENTAIKLEPHSPKEFCNEFTDNERTDNEITAVQMDPHSPEVLPKKITQDKILTVKLEPQSPEAILEESTENENSTLSPEAFPLEITENESVTIKNEPLSPDAIPGQFIENENVTVKKERQSPEEFPQGFTKLESIRVRLNPDYQEEFPEEYEDDKKLFVKAQEKFPNELKKNENMFIKTESCSDDEFTSKETKMVNSDTDTTRSDNVNAENTENHKNIDQSAKGDRSIMTVCQLGSDMYVCNQDTNAEEMDISEEAEVREQYSNNDISRCADTASKKSSNQGVHKQTTRKVYRIDFSRKFNNFIEGKHFNHFLDDTFECLICGEKYFSKYHLVRHSQDTHYIYKCNVCKISFMDIYEFEEHSRSCVYISGKGKASQVQIKEWVKENVEENLKKMDDEIKKNVEVENSQEENPVETSQEEIPVEMSSTYVKPVEISKPSVAQIKFVRGVHFQKTIDDQFYCLMCHDTFENKFAFDIHARAVHFPYSCALCPAFFKTKEELSSHVRFCVYIMGKGYQCMMCAETFRNRVLLRDHQRMHPKLKKLNYPIMFKHVLE